MKLSDKIDYAKSYAEQETVIEHVNDLIDRSDSVEVLDERPEMVPADNTTYSRLEPTGSLTITLRLSGIPDLKVAVKRKGDRCKPEDWELI